MTADWRRKEPRHLDRHYQLTKAEAAMFQLLSQGMTMEDICKALNITRETAKNRMQIIREKTR